MMVQSDTTGDQISQALAAMFGVGLAGIDWAAMLRALVEYRQEAVEQWHDRHAHLLDCEDPASADEVRLAMQRARLLGVGHDQGEAVRILMTGALAAGLIRMGRDWQDIVERSRPSLLGALDDYLADPDPSPQVRIRLVNQVGILLLRLGEFMREQGLQWEQDLVDLAHDLVPGVDPASHPGTSLP